MYIKHLKACLSHNADLQEQVDTTIQSVLDEIAEMPEYQQAYMTNFFMAVLKIDAEAGYASAQHNYGVLHISSISCHYRCS